MSVSLNGATKWMGVNFPFFCRRVCKLCIKTDATEVMLLACPVIRMDAYRYLHGRLSPARIPAALGDAISESVTEELVGAVLHETPGPRSNGHDFSQHRKELK